MPADVNHSTLEFDEFYLASRRRLVLQAYALTGELAAARSAVRDAFVAARHHWRKVSRQADPEEWVRPRAWAMAQRRHVAHLWHREKGLTAGQKSVLDALHHLPDQQRKALLLAHLASLTTARIGRELGHPVATVERQLEDAAASYCRETGVAPTSIRQSIETLAPIAEAAALPRPMMIHRNGRRRRRLHAVVGTVGLVLLTVLGGQLVAHGAGATGSAHPATHSREAPEMSRARLLNLAQVTALAPSGRWTLVGTTDNTEGSGINSVCQTTRFADPRGSGTFVRRFEARSDPRRSYVQTVEVSRTPEAAAAAYRTTMGWFAGCTEARLQLLNAYSVTGMADEAQILRLRIPNKVRRTYVVGVARTGNLTVSTVLETVGGQPPPIKDATRGLTDAVRNVCMSKAAGKCPMFTRVAPVLPPLSGETRGTLAVADLPVVGRIDKPWVGTQPTPGRPNVAATTCDKADFARSGARRPLTRTFLIPQARVPRRFGITETYGLFPQVQAGPGAGRPDRVPDGDLREEGPGRQGQQRRGPAARVPRVGVRPVAPRQRDQRQVVGRLLDGRRAGGPVRRPGELHRSGQGRHRRGQLPGPGRAGEGPSLRAHRDGGSMNGFRLPVGLVYLNGNSLGALPSTVRGRVDDVIEREWGHGLIRSWNDEGWMDLPARVAARIAPLIGVDPGDLHVGDSTSVSLFKTAVAAARLRPDRRVIVVERGTFPTDGYVLAGVADLMGLELRWCDPADPIASVDEDVALLSLSHVDFRTGAMFDLPAITTAAQDRGALVQWDLCHSAGAVPVDLAAAGADLAVGCTYKYLNGGPGSPAFLWVAPRHQDAARQPITGWMGHREPFAMSQEYAAAPGVRAFASGTPPVLSLSALEAALAAFDEVSVASLRTRSLELTDLFIALVESELPGVFEILTPREHERRGSQVSLRHHAAYGVVQALIAREVVGDFRAPDVARFGFAPLYNTLEDVRTAVDRLVLVMANEEYADPAYSSRNAVT